jgi:hypothetical protein
MALMLWLDGMMMMMMMNMNFKFTCCASWHPAWCLLPAKAWLMEVVAMHHDV